MRQDRLRSTGDDSDVNWDKGPEPDARFRSRLLSEQLSPNVTFLCAESGMGKTYLLSAAVSETVSYGYPARYVDFLGLGVPEAIVRLRELQRWVSRQRTRAERPNSIVFLAIDNMPIGDEADNDCVANALRRMVLRGATVAVAAQPEGEMLFELMGEAHCLWSCDLCMRRADVDCSELLYDTFAQGIPGLVTCIDKIDVKSVDILPTDPRFQEPYITVIEGAVREVMMEEEKQLRVAMLLMGRGSLEDLQEIVGRIDDTTWRLLPRDSPVFGVDVTHGTFCCVGSQSLDCLNLTYATLSEMARAWPRLVADVARLLAGRGDLSRAAIVSLMCADDVQRCSVGLWWGPEMLDAGEVSAVTDALESARENGLYGLRGYAQTAGVLSALLGERDKAVGPLVFEEDSHHRYAYLAWWCRGLLQGEGLTQDVEALEEDDRIESALVLHGKTIRLMIAGRVREAYNLLLEGVRFEEPTITSFLLGTDYLLCSLLMGIVPNRLDVEATERINAFLEHAGLVHLAEFQRVMLLAGMLLAGRLPQSGGFDAALQRADRAGDVCIKGFLLFVLGVSDLRVGALTRGYVRFEQSMAIFEEVGAWELSKIVRILHCAVRAQLGEKIPRPDFEACRGVSRMLDDIVSLLLAAISHAKPKRPSTVGGWGALSKSREYHWLVNILSNDCGVVSMRFKEVLPPAWRNAQARLSGEVDEYFNGAWTLANERSGPREKKEMRSDEPSKVMLEDGSLIEIKMFGGFEVYVEGVLIPSNKLDKRRSKSMLALLAAVPSHYARRYVIMETIWPTYDYDSANKCVYSATSVLRTEISSMLKKRPAEPLIVSNKAQGTVGLNTALFGTDIDRFETKARRLLDSEGSDRELVVLCREIEELYRGDLFVPPTDGMGIVEARSRELKTLFADAMVAGAHAAMNRGMKTLACRFARKAHEADALREDAMRALVTALCSAGRQVEARRCYERFVGRVVDLTRRPPSRLLREEMEVFLSDYARRSDEGKGQASVRGKNEQQMRLKLGLGKEQEGNNGDDDAQDNGLRAS